MSKRPKLLKAIRMTYTAFEKDNASRFGAALAFYIVFCIAPTVLIGIAVAGSVFGRERAESAILERIGGSFGSAAGTAVAAMIKDAPPLLRAGWFATTLALFSLYFGLSGVYRQIDDALRTIWRDKRKPVEQGTIVAIEKKFASLVVVMAVFVIVLLSILVDAAIAMTGRYAASKLIGGEWLWHVVQLLVSTVVMTALFGTMFRYLTPARVTWHNVRFGALATAILFVLGKFALGIYLGKAAVGSAFGAAGSLVVVLLWSYWSAQIFFFGLEFTHVYAQEREA